MIRTFGEELDVTLFLELLFGAARNVVVMLK